MNKEELINKVIDNHKLKPEEISFICSALKDNYYSKNPYSPHKITNGIFIDHSDFKISCKETLFIKQTLMATFKDSLNAEEDAEISKNYMILTTVLSPDQLAFLTFSLVNSLISQLRYSMPIVRTDVLNTMLVCPDAYKEDTEE